MLPFPWQIGLLGTALALAAGFLLGLSLGALSSVVLRWKRRYVLDGIAGMVGFLGALSLSAMSSEYAVELNGALVGWQRGTRWPSLRAWALGHGLLAAVIACIVCVALGRALASVADHVKPSRGLRRAGEGDGPRPQDKQPS
jgi:hypothetical protein